MDWVGPSGGGPGGNGHLLHILSGRLGLYEYVPPYDLEMPENLLEGPLELREPKYFDGCLSSAASLTDCLGFGGNVKWAKQSCVSAF